jgi:CBS domain-containing protein
MLTALDLMTAEPASIRATAKVRRAAEILQNLDVRHLPVVNDVYELVGMVSDRDLRAVSVPYFLDEETASSITAVLDAEVASIMTGEVISVDEDATAGEIVELMLEYKIGAVPVTDAEGLLVGIVSYVDVLRSLPLEIQAAE